MSGLRLLARSKATVNIAAWSTPLSSLSSAAEHRTQQDPGGAWSAAAAAAATAAGAAAGAVALLPPVEARCEPALPPLAARSSVIVGSPLEGGRGTGGSSWVPGWLSLSWLWGGGRRLHADNRFLGAIRKDPRVAVVLAYALPSLSLSFGFVPTRDDLDAAAALVEPSLGSLRPWELAILLWGAARLGYHPGRSMMEVAKRRLGEALQEQPGGPGSLSPQEAAMAAWSLAAMAELSPELWAAACRYLSRCPAEALDEVALIHLYQAALFASPHRAALQQAAAPAGSAAAVPATTTAHLPTLRSTSDEVRATLAAGGLPLPLINRCEQEYKAAASQPGFDGPSLIELAMLRMLVHLHQEGASAGGEGAAYSDFFQDVGLMDVQRARQLLDDPYLLTKFKVHADMATVPYVVVLGEREIADKRSRQNNFTRQLADISRTLTAMGLYHVTQAAVEDGLVHVDIALPDFKIAFFLEGAVKAAGAAGAARAGQEDGLLSALDAEGVVLSGYVANETPGSKAAKLRLLEQLGWKVFTVTWVESTKDDRAKRAALLALLDRAGRDALMRGRVSSALHGAMRGAEESKLGRDRFQTDSAGQYITRQH
ncbi:hypothetical protein N2152v2_003883 [Parachlorella kessleri]